MPNIALIPPYSFLLDLRNRPLQMFLPTCLNGPYSQRYRKLSHGSHVILDNGMFEDNKPIDNDTLLRMAELYLADEIVVPDVRNDSEKTLEAVKTFLSDLFDAIRTGLLEGQDPNLMFVVQGESQRHRKKMIDELAEHYTPANSVIGFPRFLTRDEHTTRLELMEYVASKYGSRFKLHMLGLSREWPAELLRATRQFGSHLRGLDTSAPYVYAYHGVTIRPQWDAGGERPNDYFSISAKRIEERLVQFNIHILESWARGFVPSAFKEWEECQK